MSKVRIPSKETFMHMTNNIGTNWEENPSFQPFYKCNHCNQYQMDKSYYCPECGQKMFDIKYPWEENKMDNTENIHYYSCFLEREGEMTGWWHYTHIENDEKTPFYIFIHTRENSIWEGYVTDAWFNGPMVRVNLVSNGTEGKPITKEFVFYTYYISKTKSEME